jgi:RNA polymerase sigma factor (sigma-70 family)
MDASDRQLLEQFATRKEERAFATLLSRHGPMVFGLCRRVLGHEPDAEDAFQATFLVLAHKAGSIRRRDSVASWLYGVAYRLASRLRARIAAQREKQRMWADSIRGQQLSTDLLSAVIWRELRPVLDEELNRLPEKYRAPLLLCYLEGKTHEEAARALGWSRGSMSRRMEKARDLLRSRLSRRGVTLSTGLLFGVIGHHVASAAAPAPVTASTLKAALMITAGRAAVAGLISTQVALLTEGVLKAMFVTKMKVAAAALLAVGLVGAGAGVFGQRAGSGNTGDQAVAQLGQEKPEPKPAKPAGEEKAEPPAKPQAGEAPPEPAAVIIPQPKGEEDPFPPKPMPGFKSRPQALRWLLDQPTDKLKGGIDPGTPLRDALQLIGEIHGVTIRANEPAFDLAAGEKGIVDRLTVAVLPSRGLPLRKMLQDMLLQLRGPAEVQATFLVRGDMIEVLPYQSVTPDALLRELVTVTFRKEPLEAALEKLLDMTGANIIVDPRIQESAKTPINAVLQHVPLDTAVRLLCDMADVESIILDNVVYVTTPENAARLQKKVEAEEGRMMEKGTGPKAPPFTPNVTGGAG